MSSHIAPIPDNEMDRILNLYEFDIDYSNLEDTFKDLTYLAAKICGTEISLVNLIDSFTQWSVSKVGIEADQMPREETVCQYTIIEQDHFEVEDLSADERFQEKPYVNGPLNLRYYFGVPLKTSAGHHIGALCVLDRTMKKLTPEKIELLKIVATEVVTRLSTIKLVQDLKAKLREEKETSKKVAHDIRGPLAGIMGISALIQEQGEDNKMDEVLEMINLIYKGSRSVLDLADEILSDKVPSKRAVADDEFTLLILKDKLIKLYEPQAKYKNIDFVVNINSTKETIPFSKNKLLQIIGNLISNAIKFTPERGSVIAELDLQTIDNHPILKISISDTGIGISQDGISNIINGIQSTASGTGGEKGYGFGLTMVKRLIDGLNGKMEISSTIGKGATFEVMIPRR